MKHLSIRLVHFLKINSLNNWLAPLALCTLFFLLASYSLSGQLPKSKQALFALFNDTKQSEDLRLEAALALQETLTDVDSLKQISQQMDRYGQQQGKMLWRGYAWKGFGDYYWMISEIDSARYAFLKAKSFYPKRDNAFYPKVLFGLAYTFYFQERDDEALYYCKKAIPWANRYAPASIKSGINHLMAIIYQNRQDYPNAFRYFETAKRDADLSMKVLIENNLSLIFRRFKMKKEEQQHAQASLKYAQQLNSPIDLARAYGIIINSVDTDARGLQNLVKKGLNFAELADDLDAYCRILSAAAKRFATDLKRYDLAEHYLDLIREEGKKHGLLCDSITYSLTLAELRVKQKRFQEALAVCREIKPKTGMDQNQYAFLEYNEQYSKAFEGLGQADSALFYLKKNNQSQAIDKDAELNRSMLLSFVEYQQKREKETLRLQKIAAEKLTKEVQRRQNTTVGIFALLTLFLVSIAGAFFVFFRQRSRTAAQLSAQNEALQKSNARLRRFSGVVSHDILSNLDLMLSAGKILVGKQPKKESLTQYYDIAQRTSRQLKDYCLGLLEEARSAVGTVSRVSDPMQVLEAILARQEIALLSKGCRVQLEPLAPSTLPESIVEQVFQNLISNALRYGMGAENPTLRIVEEKDPLRGTTRWVVEDNGAGIPLERREGIFQGSAHQEDQSQGQHLGLSLLRDTLQSYGAKIWVEERRGGGARFVVDLGMQGELVG